MSYFDRALEELEAEFNARYDYVTEAFHGLSDDAAMLRQEQELEYAEWDAGMTAAFGPVVHPVAWPPDEIPF